MIVVLNAHTLAATEYNIDAVDVMSQGSEVYFTKADGLRRLAAAEDADEGTVSSFIQTGDMAFRPGGKGNVQQAMLMLSADASMQLTAIARIDGGSLQTDYQVPLLASSYPRRGRVPLAKGPIAERWALKLLMSGAKVGWVLDRFAVIFKQSRYYRS